MIRRVLLVAGLALLAVVSACGGDDDGGTDDPNATSSNPSIGPAALLPAHMDDVTPDHGQAVSNADLSIGGTEVVSGICAEFNFEEGEGMGDDPTAAVQFFLNEENITGNTHWVTFGGNPPEGGNICYGPPSPLPVGVHSAKVQFADATGRRYEYNWQFEVTE